VAGFEALALAGGIGGESVAVFLGVGMLSRLATIMAANECCAYGGL